MTIGSRIKERRKSLGLSVDDIAARLGKNRATVYRYESDDIENLPSTVLEPLAKVLKTTPAHLMGWKDKDIFSIPNIEPIKSSTSRNNRCWHPYSCRRKFRWIYRTPR